ncbi:GspE/PulE family protein [Trichloromonas sp.]|uniref:GspE/PulE family protein n=1 Tax=Trichloromonas sp. TaxID=3069249 RepID=UPI002A4ACED7|nr:ATPase, T2SS/T4P/T4SS family [Trichloromonas sp.]
MRKQQITLNFMDGEELTATLAEAFDPAANEIKVLLEDTDIRLGYPLPDLTCILFHRDPLSGKLPPAKFDTMDEVETVTGVRYQVNIPPRQEISGGFFAVPVDTGSPWMRIFFCNHGIRDRKNRKFLGDYLEAKGLVTPDEMKKTLEVQQKLRTRRVGEILAEQNNIPQETIDRTVATATDRGRALAKARIGDILVAAGLVTRQQVEEAVATQKDGKKKRVGELLIERGLITEDQLLNALAEKFRLRYVNLEQIVPSREALATLTGEIVNRLQVLPIEKKSDLLIVVTASPTDPNLIDSLRFSANCRIELGVATRAQIAKAIEEYYPATTAPKDDVGTLIGELTEDIVTIEEEVEENKLSEADSQIIRLVNNILIDAFQKNASDIHFEPGIGNAPFRIRYRIDGVCRVAHQVSATFKHAILSRLKIMSRLDIAERRRPQSGKIMIRSGNRNLEFRLEITPSVGGQEDAVLRLLANAKALPLEDLRFSANNLKNFKECLAKPYGVILCVGPTGSGKTTTLHSALGHINTPERKIWTAEDPVEITQAGLRQVQVNAKIGFTFQAALRSFLRADPDVIMIGEMRDAETAKTAIEASLTGHLVFSTLHTNSAPETVVRLIEMGMDPINFAEAMLGVLAQRLARKLCNECKQPYHPSRQEYEDLVQHYGQEWFKMHNMPAYSENLTLMRKVGCPRCEDSGYSGRLGIHELLMGTENLKRAIKRQATAEELRHIGLEDGMTTLKMDGLAKVFMGLTDLEQVLRVCL